MNDKVSMIIIGRNEAKSIGLCADAAIAAAKQIGGAQLIYVDSHSTDDTVRIMEERGFEVVALERGMRLSPSAGRHVGSNIARGDIAVFLDADTLIYRDFLPVAIAAFEADPKLGGFSGSIDDHSESGERVIGVEEPCDAEMDVRWLRGPCCVYRRTALVQTGSFDPDLAMEEEAELGLRLTGSGWRLRKAPVPMARHTRCFHGDSITSIWATFKRDWRSGRLGEITRTISHAFIAGYGIPFCWMRLNTTILFVGWALLASAAMLLPARYYPGTIALLITAVTFAAVYYRKRRLYQALIFFPSKLLNVIDILMGVHKIKLRGARTAAPTIVAER